MPERNLAIRLSVMEGGKVKAELSDIGDSGQKSLQKIELAGEPASKGLLAINAAANDVKGSVSSLAEEMGPLGSGLMALGPAGLAAAAALSVVTLGIEKSIEEAMEAEKSHNRLQAVLRATGESSGLTAKQISEIGDSMESSMLTTSEKVQDAAAVLATFHSVSGDTFTRAIKLAQDMSAVFGQDLSSSAMRLGRALEDPTEGLTALRRVGVTFTAGQKELIQSLVDTGQTAEAQKVILDALEKKVGGAGEGEASGVTGAAHQLAISWKNMLEAIGQTETVSGGAEASLKGLASVLDMVGGWFKDAPIDKQLDSAKANLSEAQAVLERLNNFQPTVMTDMTPLIEKQKQKIADLRTEVEKLTISKQKEADADAAAKAQAAEGQQAAAKDQRAEQLADQRKKLDEAMSKLMTDPSEKIAKVNAELATTKQRLESLREKDGSNNSNVDAAITEAEQVAHRQLDAIQKPIDEATQKAAEANQKVISDLQRQLLGLSNARQVSVDQAVSRLSDKASDADRTKVRDLAGQLFDQKSAAEVEKVMSDLGKEMDKLKDKRQAFINEAVQKLPETATQADIDRVKQYAAAVYDQQQAEEKLDKLKKEGKQLTDQTKTSTEAYADRIAKLNELLNAGAISQEIYNKAKSKADDELLAGRTDADAGITRAFNAYKKDADDTASAIEKAFSSAMTKTDDAIVSMVTTGTVSLKSLGKVVDSIVEDITRLVIRQSITEPLYQSIAGSMTSGGTLSSLFSGLFHEGGVVGDTSNGREVPSYVFAGAPRYHSGGIAGLGADEVPAILQRGETILPKNSRTGSPINLVMNISTPDASSFRASQAQLSAEMARGIGRAKRNL